MSSSDARQRGSARSVLLAVLALVAATAGAMAFIYRVTGDESGSTPAAAADPSPPPPAAPLEPPPEPVRRPVANLGPPENPPPPLVTSGPRPKVEPGSWSAVPAVSRTTALGTVVGGALHRGLAQAAPQLAACFEAEVARMDESNELPTLILNVETRDGQVVIVDAAPMNEAGATVELLGCAINAVKGRSFPAPGAKAGQRNRLIHPIRR